MDGSPKYSPLKKSWSEMSPADYMKLLNIQSAKLVAVILVIAFGAYHGILHFTYGVTPCKGLFIDGMLKGDSWQPWGCMMHKYTKADSERCFRYNAFLYRKNYVAFIGDSRTRQIFHATRRLLTSGQDPKMFEEDFPSHENIVINEKHDLVLEFYWAPTLNETMQKIFEKWRTGDGPNLVIVGCGTHTIKESNNSLAALDEWGRNLTRIKLELENLADFGNSKVLWLMQPPVHHENLKEARKMITNSAIDAYNSMVEKVFRRSTSVGMWYSVRRLVEGTPELLLDGMHMAPLQLKLATQMLLNLHCNDNMNFNDGSCCKSSDQATNLQIITFAFFGLCISFYILGLCYKGLCRRRPSHVIDDVRNKVKVYAGDDRDWNALLFALAKMGVILGYFYVCDRTNFFMKENKYFTPINFWLPLLYILVVGLFFNEESKHTRFMHRQQTEEWKGWMQLVILIYHMTGASKSLPVYMHVRVLVSAYLFLNGFGNFCQYWLRGDLSLIRFFQVVFRLNFLAVVLCLAMNRPYQFYYFVPLISFWFAVQYVMHVSPPHVTAQSSENLPIQYLYVVLKVVGLISVISVLYMSEVFFEKVFVTRPWKALFVTTDDDIHEWWFRWKLDRYSLLYGIAFAFLCQLGHRHRLYDDSSSSGLWPPSISVVVAIGSVVGIVSYLIFSCLCRSKTDCNEVHPYISFIPIVSYLLLRNTSGFLRSRYSSFFAWFGKISLELFIGQCHIWLAADTHGVLVLIPNYPVMNILLTSFIFVCAAHEIHSITEVIMPFVVPSDYKMVIRNVVIFVLILIPIGIHDGMF